MKTFFAVILAAILCTSMGSSCNRPCVTDMDCRKDECCALSFTGEGMVCREMGERVGEACGAPYLCSKCDRNLTCSMLASAAKLHLGQVDNGLQVPDSSVVSEPMTSCPHPASSTCQNITITPVEAVKTSEEVRPEDMSYGQQEL